MSEPSETPNYEAPRFEVIGSLHELTQATVSAKLEGEFTDVFNTPWNVQVS